MTAMVSYIRQMIGKDTRRLLIPILFSMFDSVFNSCIYGVMILTLIQLTEGQFTEAVLRNNTIYLVLFFLGRCLSQCIGYTHMQCTGPDFSRRLRLEVGNHIRSLNLGFFNKNSIGRLNSTLLSDISDFETIITHCVCDFIKVFTFLAMALLISLSVDWRYGLLILLLTALAFPCLYIAGKISARNSVKLRKASQNVISRIAEYISGIKTFRLYNLTGERFSRLDDSLKQLKQESVRNELSVLPYGLGFSAITSLILPAALILGAHLLIQRDISVINFLIVILLSISVTSTLNVLSSLYPQVKAMNKACENILSILAEKPFTYEKETLNAEEYHIRFDNVTFRYNEDVDVLNKISFSAKHGTTTALIGPSGSGKTTIVSLISRFWDINSGRISINGEDIRHFSPDALTEKMAVVFQDVYLLNDTVYNNIKIGNSKADKAQIVQAAKDAHCHDFIMEMGHGYDTMVGEGGSTLSGGEKQRISIARALLKDAPIILLDETTSSLDADNEYEIQQAFDRLMKNKTVLVIAHRLNTIINADHIIVLDMGQIRESGTHRQLLTAGGWYARMYEEQQQAQHWQV